MFEFRLRVLDVRESEADLQSFLGVVEGFPDVVVYATTLEEVERDLTNALGDHLRRLQDHDATRLELDDFPTVRLTRCFLSLRLM